MVPARSRQQGIELKDLHARLGATFVFVTHDQIEAMSLADRIVIMSEGRIEQIGTPMDLYGRPASAFVAEFIGAPPMKVCDLGSPAGQAIASLGMAAATGAASVGIRPEALRLADAGPAAKVTLVEALGAETLVHLRLGEDRLVLRAGHGTRPAPGQIVHLWADPLGVAWFDAERRALRA
ncbi:TOBE domain-containing protein [Roseibacterium sp. SDUM158017]|uniref:TOBE domain-containing protein n=1 Tax=Roseicyclus salinarum TaxID=3036773 RepID=UPI00241541B9|nr:TOBE domain-containing protein [Roseibacterium sp. SDUM158017]MDG4649264.1 TOBE domain-containing protein [Roseibacterium sp. SDUM158017]